MKSFFAWIIMISLLIFAILDFLKLVEPRAPQPQTNPYAVRQTTTRRIIQGATQPIRVRPEAAARIIKTVEEIESATLQAKPVRLFRDYEPSEGVTLIFPGAGDSFTPDPADIAPPQTREERIAARAQQLIQESNQRILNNARARQCAAGE